MDDTAQKILVGVVTPLALAFVYWANRRVVPPAVAFARGLGTLVADVRDIKLELQSNGGRSLKDHVGEISNALTMLESRQRGLVAAMPRPMFETDCEFNWVDGNIAMERLIGSGFAHLERRRWVSLIHHDDRADVMEEITNAVKDKRSASVSFRFVTDVGDVPVKLDAHPVFSRITKHQVICWLGTLTRLDDRRVDERRI